MYLLRSLLRGLERVEQLLVSLILTAIIILAAYQIGLRWFTSGGLPWIDPLLRYLVLWGGLFGAALATARSQHISLDVTEYLLPQGFKPLLKLLAMSFSTLVSLFLFRASLMFLKSELEYGGGSLLTIPYWIWYLIFPISFGLVTLHFFGNFLLTLEKMIRGATPPRLEG